MNKPLSVIFNTLFFAFVLTGCDDHEDEIYPSQTFERYIAGQWEQIDGPDRGCIYDITIATNPSEGTYGYVYGQITTYYLTIGGTPIYDKEFSWSVREIENHYPLLDLIFTGELDGDDASSGDYHYKIIKIDDSFMWWQTTTGDNSILKFKRRTDPGDL